jgi:hypothetical protein
LALYCLDIADGDLPGASIFLCIESNLLSFDEPTHSGSLERGGMDENVLAAAVGLNEAEAILVVVEFHGTGIQLRILSLIQVHMIRRRACARLETKFRCLEGLNVRLIISAGETA